MKVIGVDPGTLATGFGVVSENKGKLTCHTYGVIKTGSKTAMPLRLKKISDGLKKVIAEHQPESLALEESFVAKNPQSAMKLGQARGVIMLVAEETGLAFAEYSPNKIKQSVVGYGKADKDQVCVMVRHLLSLKETPQPHDASDALATAITHISHTASPMMASS